MASSPSLLLLVFALLALAAAQRDWPFPPSQQQQQQQHPTKGSDAAALRAVFRQWGLEDGAAAAAAAEDPCWKRVWFESHAKNASVGCVCDNATSECRVTHLNVTGYWNITEIPRALFDLTELVSLDLSNNNLSGSIPPEVANLSKLETWHFNNNQLGGPFPDESSRLMNLQSLRMFDNYFEGSLPEFIANFTNLTDLRIYGMRLRGPIPEKFSNLINLKNLMLGDLDGGNSTFDFIADWANLSTLSLRKCGIIGELPSTSPTLPNLAYLDLRSNNLSGSIQLLLPYKSSRYLHRLQSNIISAHYIGSSLGFWSKHLEWPDPRVALPRLQPCRPHPFQTAPCQTQHAFHPTLFGLSSLGGTLFGLYYSTREFTLTLSKTEGCQRSSCE